MSSAYKTRKPYTVGLVVLSLCQFLRQCIAGKENGQQSKGT